MQNYQNYNELDTGFLHQVERKSGEKVTTCYQCGKCSAGCPVGFAMDYLPNQIIRMVQLGMREKTLSSRSIWLCASCETCSTRCPQEVDLTKIMDTLREMSFVEEAGAKEKEVSLFNQLFMKSIKRYGRQFETAVMGSFNLKSGHYVKDVPLALRMLLKKKLSLFPPKTNSIKKIEEIFTKVKKMEKR